eukprot:2644369-Rhodomonas_salina.2
MSSGSVVKKASEKASIACRGDIASKLEFAIVGGGIGGLATALHLIKKGIRYIRCVASTPWLRCSPDSLPCWLLESKSSNRIPPSASGDRLTGFGLTLQQGGLALSSLGLGDAVAKAAAYSQYTHGTRL